MLCVGGGVLLSTVFIHMLPEVRDSMDRAKVVGMINTEADYPFAELIICMGKSNNSLLFYNNIHFQGSCLFCS